ncbi:MAG TPA: 23S rRNA (adenine(2503)-C(2))-methyltransferase RlmN [Pseudolabrys sp.]|nr:23S rRNA (adenine(2503)-C(2))-methyltransferase RlmN [Pseudolabrys sp.]
MDAQLKAEDLIEKTPLERYVAPERPSLIGYTRAQLADALGRLGVPDSQRKMRVQQLWHWIYFRGFTSFDDMTSVSKELRAALSRHFTLARPEVVAEQVSVDGTRKWLLRLPGEMQGERPHEVECVYIPDTERGTLCLSSQVGCTLNCSFCHTGTQRLVRNLTAGEIVGQVMAARDRLGDWPGGTRPTDGVVPYGERCITNIVMMGMGEPLYNFDAVRDALLIVADGEGIAISKRRITLSTAGVVPNIARTGAEIGCMLAVSLHAVRDDLRNELVPLNRKYPIAELLEACRNYPGVSNAKRITFEYVMLQGVNDSIDDAKALVRLLKGIPAKINLIPFNPWPGTKYECSDWEQIEKFSQIIFDAGYASPVRTPRGRDILAACGQLKSTSEKLSARERLALRAMTMVE